MKDTQSLIGKKITEDYEKDAIHIAVLPAIAGERLSPGQHVGIGKDGFSFGDYKCGKFLGVVDPFLKEVLEPGDRFWMFMYPNTITGLRHVWTHPDVLDGASPKDRAASEKWIRDYIDASDCPDYDTLVSALIGEYVPPAEYDIDSAYITVDNEYLHFNGRDAHGDINPELFYHVEVVTGRKCVARPKYFSCSC